MTSERVEREAFERLHSGTDGLILPADSDTPRWLNHPDAINDLVRSFMAEFIRKVPDLTGEELQVWTDNEARSMNSIFLGFIPGEKRDDYIRNPWNTPGQLGQSIGANLGIDIDDTRLAVRDAFVVTAAHVHSLLGENDGVPLDQWGWRLDALCADLTNALLGLPVAEDDEDQGEMGVTPNSDPED